MMRILCLYISLENHAEYYEIVNNSFEGYHIKFPSSTRFIENLVFEDNTIVADKMSGTIVHLQTNDEFEVGTIEFSHNIIDVKEHEDRIREEIKSGGSLGSVLKLKKWEKKVG